MLRLKDSGQVLLDNILQEAADQGHTLTGRLAKESRIVVYGNPELDNLIGVQILMPPYATQLERGIRKGRVPFASARSRRARGTTSDYIQALQDFFQKRYPSATTARTKELAIRTAKVARRTGHPTPGSYKYSTNNRRLGFIEKAVGKTSLKVLEQKLNIGRFVEGKIVQKLTSFRLLTTGRGNG